jgi:hypothetical protein
MRGFANLRSYKSLLSTVGGVAVLLAAEAVCAEQHAEPAASGPLKAILHPVNRATGAVNQDISMGSVRFAPGKSGGMDITFQVSGISVQGSEEEDGADGTGNAYPRGVVIFPGTCEAAAKGGPTGGERLPDLQVQSDGTATSFANTKQDAAKLIGQTVVISKPGKPGAADGVINACGVIKADK